MHKSHINKLVKHVGIIKMYYVFFRFPPSVFTVIGNSVSAVAA